MQCTVRRSDAVDGRRSLRGGLYAPPVPAVLSDLELLGRLVAIDTTSRLSNRPFDDAVRDYLDDPRVRIETFPCGPEHENLLISIGPECTNGEGLLLAAHVDTVPAEEPEWTSDPRRLVLTGDRAIGRGACDMKGFVALALNLLRERLSEPPKEPLALLLTCNEEIGTKGAAAFAESWQRGRPLPKRCLVGEPTSLKVVRGHKGHLHLSLALRGVAAHSGFPHKGVNAIERAGAVIAALAVLRKTLAQERTEASRLFPEVPFPVLTIAGIRGGSAINVVPERCVIDVGVRLLPGMDSAGFVERCGEAVRAVVPEAAVAIEIGNDTPAFATPPERPFVCEMLAVLGQPEAEGVGFGTDAGRLARLGLDCVVWGPGDISVAHRADEWMPLDEFARAATLLRGLVR